MDAAPDSEVGRSRVFERCAVALFACYLLYLAVVLTGAIVRTGHLEQDAAYYVHVVERAVAGDGFNSLSDRRGPAPWAPFPLPFDATNRWPWLLAACSLLTGEARTTGMAISALSFLGAILLLAVLLRRGTTSRWWIAGLLAASALVHRRILEFMVLPLSDGLSLLLNVGVLWAISTRRNAAALVLAGLAGVARFQNLALAFPLAWALLARWPRARAAVLAGGALAGFAMAGMAAPSGVRTFLDPFESVSIWRTMRFLTVPTLVGLWVGRREPFLMPFLLFGAGHFLVILGNPDSAMETPWLFGARHAMPFLVTAAACGAVAVARTRGWLRIAVLVAAGVAAVDHGGKVHRLMRDRPARTALQPIAAMVTHLRGQPLPEGAVLLCHDIDVLTLELGVRGVHLRGFEPDAPDLVEHLRRRRVTHVLLTWFDKRVLAGRNQWMTDLHEVLAPHTVVVHETSGKDPGWRAVLLRWR